MFPLKDNLRCSIVPWATITIILLNCVAFVLEGMYMSRDFIMTYTMIPNKVVDAFASGDPHLIGAASMSVFTAMFLHGGFMHLFGNMLFLAVFGKAIEARLGRTWFVLFYLVSGIAAAGAHIWSDPASTIPTLGASGAIAGVLGGYLMLWPKATIYGLVPLPISARGSNIPFTAEARAYWYIIFWVISQFSGIMSATASDMAGELMLSGFTLFASGGIAYWAHIGGFVGGFLLGGLVRKVQPVTDVCYIETACAPCEKKDDQSTGE